MGGTERDKYSALTDMYISERIRKERSGEIPAQYCHGDGSMKDLFIGFESKLQIGLVASALRGVM